MAQLTDYQIYDLLNRPGPLWLAGVDLSGANLWFADLQGANLRGANLKGAALEGANLQGAKLDYANLKGAELAGAHLELAEFKDTTTLPDGARWGPDSDLSRFTDPDHPDFWRPSG